MKKWIVPVLSVIGLCCSVLGHSQSFTWYKEYKGTIGNSTVTMHLAKSDSTYNGYYYFDSNQLPVAISGTGTGLQSATSTIGLSGYSPKSPEEDEEMNLQLAGDRITGTWKKNKVSKSQPVALTTSTSGNTKFSLVHTDSSVLLRPNMDESPEARYSTSSVWPDASNELAPVLKPVIISLLDLVPGKKELPDLVKITQSAFLKSYLNDFKGESDSAISEMKYSYSLDQTSTVQVMYQSPALISLAHYFYYYSGGAHGNYATHYSVTDLDLKKKLKLTDVLTAAGIAKLDKLLEKQFREDRSLTATELLTDAGLFDNFIRHNENFFLTGKGIGFGFAPYEISAYAVGEIIIYLPFTVINTYLKPAFKKG